MPLMHNTRAEKDITSQEKDQQEYQTGLVLVCLSEVVAKARLGIQLLTNCLRPALNANAQFLQTKTYK